jgi:hypothetical protein
VILCFHRHMAHVSASRGTGSLFGNLLLSFSTKNKSAKVSGTSTANVASVLFFGFHWSFAILEPAGKGLPSAGMPDLKAAIIVGFAFTVHRQTLLTLIATN